MKKILITGANGFIGRNTAKYFANQGFEVHGIGLGNWKNDEEFANSGLSFWVENEVSLENLKQFNTDFDFVIHCAGSGSVGFSIANPLSDWEQNVGTVAFVLEYMRIYNPTARLIILSSAAVYGLQKLIPIKESEHLLPVSPYGFHKKMAEELCQSYFKNFGIKTIVLRLFSVYGNGLTKQLLWDACKKCSLAQPNTEILFFGTGDEVRDWIHIDDVVRLIELATKIKANFEIINGATGIKTTNREILELLLKKIDKGLKLQFNQERRIGDPLFYWADIEKLIAYNWKPNMNLNAEIENYVEWYKIMKND